MRNSADSRAQIRDQIGYWHRRWRRGQKAWSVAHHVSLSGAAIISVAIAFIIQINAQLLSSVSNENLSTVLAFFAAALSALAAAGRFQQKWRANRLSRSRLDELRIDFTDSNADLHNVRERLKGIIKEHDQEILGGDLKAVAGGADSASGQESRGSGAA